jgi:hypothetical protein
MRFQFQVEVAHLTAPDLLDDAAPIHQMLRRDQMAINFHRVIRADAEITPRHAGGDGAGLDQDGRGFGCHGRIARHRNIHEANPAEWFKPGLAIAHRQHHIPGAEVFHRVFAIRRDDACAFREADNAFPALAVDGLTAPLVIDPGQAVDGVIIHRARTPTQAKVERVTADAANKRVTAGFRGAAEVAFIPGAEIEPVIARPTDQKVRIRATQECISLRTAIQRIIAKAAIQAVGARAARQAVITDDRGPDGNTPLRIAFVCVPGSKLKASIPIKVNKLNPGVRIDSINSLKPREGVGGASQRCETAIRFKPIGN